MQANLSRDGRIGRDSARALQHGLEFACLQTRIIFYTVKITPFKWEAGNYQNYRNYRQYLIFPWHKKFSLTSVNYLRPICTVGFCKNQCELHSELTCISCLRHYPGHQLSFVASEIRHEVEFLHSQMRHQNDITAGMCWSFWMIRPQCVSNIIWLAPIPWRNDEACL